MSAGTWVGSPRAYTRGRKMAVQLGVTHYTAGSEGPTSAEGGAAYDKVRTDGTSTHAFADSNSVAVEVLDEDRAHHARAHGNEIGLGLELCGTAQTRAQWLDPVSLATLRNGAAWMAEKCVKFGLPVRRLSVPEVRAAYYAPAGQRPKGICGHVDVTNAFPEDQGDHQDPGVAFPWDVYLGLIQTEVNRLQGGSPMAKIFIVSDGPVRGGVYASGGSGFFWIDEPSDLVAYCAEWGISETPEKTLDMADARRRYGPWLGSSNGLPDPEPGPPGKDGAAVLVPHTHDGGATGPAKPTA